jgi:collagenase-like PrtC family protease
VAEFTLPLNWQDDYFTRLDFTGVAEVYGKLREDFAGGGKSSMAQPEPTRAEVARTVREAHRRGLEFNYLLNTTCIANLELTRAGYGRIRSLLDWLDDIGVDTVTVALPFLAEVLRMHYPRLRISVSTQAGVDSLEKVRAWTDLGAESITLSHVAMNRNFRELARITRHGGCAVQLIVNMMCRRACPFVTLHGNFNAHASQGWSRTNRFNIDYYFVACLARAFSDPVAVIKGNWIRPEDLPRFEALGVRRFKIVERGLTTDALVVIKDAYARGRHEGNFIDLIPTMSKYVFMERANFARTVRELLRLDLVNVLRMRTAIATWKRLRDSPAYFRNLDLHVDNRALDGAMERFEAIDCASTRCEDCGHCERLARDAVRVVASAEEYAQHRQELATLLERLVSGHYFRFLG